MILNDCGFVQLTTKSRRVCLDFVHGAEPFGQLRRELIIELPPVLIPDLRLEAVQNLNVEEMLKKILINVARLTFFSMSCRSLFGLLHEAAASQKKMKSGTTPAGLTVIIWHIPRKAESFSSLSRMLRNDEHLDVGGKLFRNLNIAESLSFLNFNPIKSAQNH